MKSFNINLFRKADFQLLGKLDDDRRYLEELIKNPVLKKHHDPTGEHFGSNVVRHKVTKNVFLNNVKEQILIKLYVFSL